MNIITVDIGWGDSGKGSIVNYLTHPQHSPFKEFIGNQIVIRYSGGHQCAHKVITEDGKEFVFSQLGSGSINNVPTYLTGDVIVEFEAMLREATWFKKTFNISPDITIDPECPVTTPYHKLFNRGLHLSQIDNHKTHGTHINGTCGLGIGLTRLTDMHGIGITAGDPIKSKQFKMIRDFLLDYYYSHGGKAKHIEDMPSPYECEKRLIAARNAMQSSSKLRIKKMQWWSDTQYIFEAAQGVALNEYTGINPKESTWGDVTARNAIEILNCSDKYQYHILGIMRSYATRHGGDISKITMRDNLLPCEHTFKPLELVDADSYNEWQGNFKSYVWNMSVLEKLINMSQCDSIAVNHLDQGAYFGDNMVQTDTESESGSLQVAVKRSNMQLECHGVLGKKVSINGFGPMASQKKVVFPAWKPLDKDVALAT